MTSNQTVTEPCLTPSKLAKLPLPTLLLRKGPTVTAPTFPCRFDICNFFFHLTLQHPIPPSTLPSTLGTRCDRRLDLTACYSRGFYDLESERHALLTGRPEHTLLGKAIVTEAREDDLHPASHFCAFLPQAFSSSPGRFLFTF
ncbi:hypothetical protein CABS01_11034 [Colletotrichum abscissum]|uniref:Uncharacterized protein n=1 Tax=Colletotrichum abscissum TaxID=1671311 RepID=A0A9P9X8X5_9PEZI|nr:uncharacterized protein CABS01_11034 [Colletotrichum abscissum]KAI3543214.1 hypothetical protein CABS02_10091 [Colletotrichum abscissum]KAK1496885.1 hypothetical protein CABS01_11034 [Colletotrichum abscissum]